MATHHWDPSDANLVSTTIRERLLCVPCIVERTGVTRVRVGAILTTFTETRVVQRELAPCQACGVRREVFRLS